MGVRRVAVLVAAVGIVNLLTALAWPDNGRHRVAGPHRWSELAALGSGGLHRMAVPVDGGALGRTQSLLAGLLLVTVAWHLMARRWVAWVGGVTALGLATLVAIPHRPPAMTLAGGSLVALVSLRREFATRPDPAHARPAGRIGLAALVAAAVGGGWVVVAERGTPSSWHALALTLAVAGVVVVAGVVAFAPASPPHPGAPVERDAVRALVSHGPPDSLAPFATRADKTYVFSPDRRAAIGYRVLLGTALAGGDPVGSPDSAPEAMAAFVRLCARRGWRPAVLGAGDEMAARWRALGLHGLHIGDEAVLSVAAFSLESHRMRNVRQAVSRTRNAGVTVAIGPLTGPLAARLAPVLEQWLGGARERGFAMNLDAILAPRPDCLVAVAYGRGGEPVAFARFAACAGGSVYTLDVAPRAVGAPNGVAERLIVEMVGYARSHGARELSLNFAALRWAYDRRGPLSRLVAAALRPLDRWIEVAPLNRFCGKFQPTWRPRHLMLRSWSQLGLVAAAALRAELGPAAGRRDGGIVGSGAGDANGDDADGVSPGTA